MKIHEYGPWTEYFIRPISERFFSRSSMQGPFFIRGHQPFIETNQMVKRIYTNHEVGSYQWLYSGEGWRGVRP